MPELSFYVKAKEYFKQHFSEKILFVVATDDKPWANEHLTAPDTFISPANDPIVDLAVLAATNNTIINGASSFGWWAGFLTGGTNVYFKDYKELHTEMDRIMKTEDRFYEPTWIPMGNWPGIFFSLWPLLLTWFNFNPSMDK